MRKIYFVFALTLLWILPTEGQVTFISPDVNSACGQTNICIEVTVENFIQVSGFQFTYSWDETVLQYDEVKELNSELPGFDPSDYNENFVGQGDITFAWIAPNFQGQDLDQEDVLFEICFDIIGSPDTDLEFTDNVTRRLVTGTGSFPPPPITNVEWTDGSFTVGGNDTTPPVLSGCPTDFSVNNDAGLCSAVVNWTPPTATDNCDPNPAITSTPANGATLPVGNTTVTYTATDAAGNTSTCTFVVTVNDTESPTINCPTDITLTASSGSTTATPGSGTEPTTTDNCNANLSVSYSTPNVGSGNGNVNNVAFPVGTTTVTYTVTDGTNTDDCTFSVTVLPNSNNNDVSFIAETENVLCGATTASIDISVRDFVNISGFQYTISWDAANLDFTSISFITTELPDFNASNIELAFTATGDITVAWIDGDLSGEMLDDNTVLFTIEYNIIGSAPRPVNFTSDITPQLVTGVGGFPPPSVPANFIDGGVVIQGDNVPPSITCPANQTEILDANCSYALADYTGLASATDNCPGTVGVTQSPAAGTTGSGNTLVTLTATDLSGNTTTCTFSVIGQDNTPPTLTCPGNQIEDLDANCTYNIGDFTTNAATDNCPQNLMITQSPQPGSGFSGVTVVTLTATDGANTTSCTFTITGEDSTPPTLTCPGSATVALDANCGFTLPDYTQSASATDNCPGTLTITQTPAAGTVISAATTITLSTTDAAGNPASCTFVITPTDQTPPSITCPANSTVDLDANCTAVLADFTNAAVTDNCPGNLVVTQDPAAGTSISTATVVTLSTTDAAGNPASCTFTVTPNDVTPPTVTCPGNRTETVDANCQFQIPDYTNLGSVDDNCDNNLTIVQSPAAGTVVSSQTTITFTATDAAGNTGTCSFTLDLTGNTLSITCPGNDAVNADANCEATLADYTAAATANSPCAPIQSITQNPLAGTIISSTTVVTLTATDALGNTATCNFTVSVNDVTPPALFCPTTTPILDLDANCEAQLADYTLLATFSDNCDQSVDIVQNPAAGTTISANTVVTLTATDNAGLSSSCSFTVTVEDNLPPTLVCPPTQTGTVDQNCQFILPDYSGLANVDDNCDANVTITQSPAIGTTVAANSVITLTATDAAGNSASCSFNLELSGGTLSITCPTDQTLTADANCSAALADYTGSATATSPCAAIQSIVQNPPAGTIITASTPVVLTATDAAGNTASCSFNVNLEDTTPPTVTCPADQTVGLGTNCQALLDDYAANATATDNCDANPSIVQFPTPGTPITGSVVVMLTATDAAGNTAVCTFNVNANDAPPTIQCPADQAVAVDQDCNYVLADYTAQVFVNDDCSTNIIVTQIPAAGSGQSGTTVVTLTATDDAGNTATCTFNVLAADNTAPTVSCPATVNADLDANCTYTILDYTNAATSSDNCDPNPAITQDPPAGTVINGPSAVTVTLSATDQSGNTGSCSFTVDVRDNTPPAFTCPGDMEFTAAPGQNTEVVNNLDPGAMDNCGLDRVIYTLLGATTGSGLNDASGTTFNLGTTLVTYTATDINGNTSQCSFNITVNGPVAIACPDDVTVDNIAGTCSARVGNIPLNITAGNAMVQSVSYSLEGATTGSGADDASDLIFNVGVTTVTYTVLDQNDNPIVCSFQVRVRDVEAPTLDCPADMTVDLTPGFCASRIADGLDATNLNDNCRIESVDFTLTGATQASGTVSANNSLFEVGTTTVTYIATDEDGNTGTCSFEVTVTDPIVPEITCPADMTVQADVGASSAIVNNLTPTVVDNCDNTVIYALSGATTGSGSDDASGNDFLIGVTTVTYTVTDDFGNIDECSFTITVEETIALSLVINCPSNVAVPTDAGNCSAVVSGISASANLSATFSYQLSGATTGSGNDDASGTTFNPGVTTVTYNALSTDGQDASCSFTVIVSDREDPVISCPNDVFVIVGPGGSAVVDNIAATASDNCNADITYQLSGASTGSGNGDASGLLYPIGITTVTYIATDAAGNTASCSFLITIEEQTQLSLEIDCPANIVTETAPGGCAAIVSNLEVSVNLSANLIDRIDFELDGSTQAAGLNNASGQNFNTGITTVTYTVRTTDGQEETCSFVVEVIDREAPALQCPDNVVGSTCNPAILGLNPVMSDNCGNVNLSYEVSGASSGSGNGSVNGFIFVEGITQVTYTATDDSGNATTCSFTIELDGSSPLSLDCPASGTFPTDPGRCSATLNNIDPIVNGGCGNVDVSYAISGNTTLNGNGSASGQPFSPGFNTITYTVTDGAGNVESCSFEIMVIDTEPPFIACPDDLTVTAAPGQTSVVVNDIAPLQGSVSDNCGVSNWAFNLTGATNGNGGIDASGSSFNIGTTNVMYLVSDFAGNFFNCFFTVTVLPGAPADLISCPDDIVLEADGSCMAVANNIAPTLLVDRNDLSSLTYVVNGASTFNGSENASGSSFSLGLNTVTYTAVSNDGTSDVCSFTVVVEDNTAPQIVCPTNIQIEDAGNCQFRVSWDDPQASDNCAVDAITSTHNSGTLFPEGTTTVIYTATDASGNRATCSFEVTTADNSGPVISNCPQDVTLEADGNCEAVHTWDDPTVTDNCGNATLSCDRESGSSFPLGTTVVTCTAVDDAGNTASCSFRVTVVNRSLPQISCPVDVTLQASTTECSAVHTWDDPVVNNNCGTVNVSCDRVSGSIFQLGQTVVTCTATDADGNTSTCQFTVTVVDESAPLVSCPEDVELLIDGTIISDPSNIIDMANSNNCENVMVDFNALIANDNCDNQISTTIPSQVFPLGTRTITVMVADLSGNFVECSFDVTVRGLTPLDIEAVSSTSLCEGEDLILNVQTLPNQGSFNWITPLGEIITDRILRIDDVDVNDAGTYQLVLTSGICLVRTTVEVSVSPAPAFEVVTNSPVCDGNLSLNVLVASGSPEIATYSWTGPCGFSASEAEVMLADVDDNCSGTYTLTVVTTDGCSVSESVEVSINQLPSVSVSIQCDPILCEDSGCTLVGTEIAGTNVEYHWMSNRPGDDGLPSVINTNQIMVNPTDTGTFTYSYWITIGDCSSDTATASIQIAGSPDAVDDFLTTPYVTELTNFTILDNDVFFGSIPNSVEILDRPDNGVLIDNTDGTYTYIPNEVFIGTDQFTYRLCYECNGEIKCDDATVTIEVTYDEQCAIPTLISPNNDGINDALIILCLETGEFAQNEIIIVNEWGDQVFRAKPYLNNWEGTLNGENGKDLPDGTYFYLFKENPAAKEQKGFITIFR